MQGNCAPFPIQMKQDDAQAETMLCLRRLVDQPHFPGMWPTSRDVWLPRYASADEGAGRDSKGKETDLLVGLVRGRPRQCLHQLAIIAVAEYRTETARVETAMRHRSP